MFINIVLRFTSDRLSGPLFFAPALLLSMLTALFLPSSSVSLSYFILAVPMRERLGKHSYMSSQFPIAILNGTSFFSLWCKSNKTCPTDTNIGFVPEVDVQTI